MVRTMVALLASIAVFVVLMAGGGVTKSAFAVKAPSTEERQKGEAGHEAQKKERAKEIQKSGCAHGKDKKTGKCYQPREGQFYEDSKGNVHVKGVDCVNLPWKPCGGKKKAGK